MFEIQSALLVYALGIVIGLTVMRDRWPARLVTALVWPLGPVAFIVVLAIMLVTAAILWPVMILGSAAVLGAVMYLTAC